NYASTLRKHLLPDLGEIEIRRLDRLAARAYLNQLAELGVAAGAVERIRAVLRNGFNYAIEGGALATNPAHKVKGARSMRTDEPVFLGPEGVEALVWAIVTPPRPPRHPERRYPELGLLVRFAAYTGLRASEITALRVGRVDIHRRRLDVVEAATEGGGGLT